MQEMQDDKERDHCDGPHEQREWPQRANEERNVWIKCPQTRAELHISMPRVTRQSKQARQRSPSPVRAPLRRVAATHRG